MIAAVAVIMGIVLFDIAPESVRSIGVVATLALLLAGLSVGFGLKFNRHRSSALISPLGLAIWLHSLLEGALVATSLRLDPHLGALVFVGVVLHLMPEILAVTILLYRLGSSLKQALAVSFISSGILFASFIAFKFIPVNVAPLQILATTLGGVLLYIGATTLYRQSLA